MHFIYIHAYTVYTRRCSQNIQLAPSLYTILLLDMIYIKERPTIYFEQKMVEVVKKPTTSGKGWPSSHKTNWSRTRHLHIHLFFFLLHAYRAWYTIVVISCDHDLRNQNADPLNFQTVSYLPIIWLDIKDQSWKGKGYDQYNINYSIYIWYTHWLVAYFMLSKDGAYSIWQHCSGEELDGLHQIA